MSPATARMALVMVLGQAVLDTVVNGTSGALAVDTPQLNLPLGVVTEPCPAQTPSTEPDSCQNPSGGQVLEKVIPGKVNDSRAGDSSNLP